MKLSKLYGFVNILFGAVIIAAPWTFAYVCGREMRDGTAVCHTTRLYAMAAGAVVILLGILLIKFKSFAADKIMCLLLTLAGIATILIPTYFAPVCKSPSMHCRTALLPFLIVAGSAITLFGLIFLLRGVKKKAKQPEAEKEAEPQIDEAIEAALADEEAAADEEPQAGAGGE